MDLSPPPTRDPAAHTAGRGVLPDSGDRWRRFGPEYDRAVGAADRLVRRVMRDRGYTAQEHERQPADLSVGHARALDHYRAARQAGVRLESHESSTGELREAISGRIVAGAARPRSCHPPPLPKPFRTGTPGTSAGGRERTAGCRR